MRKAVAYYHSVRNRGIEDGSDAQRRAEERYAKEYNITIIKHYQEITRPYHAGCPILVDALASAKRSRAQLMVAKFTLLARNSAFINAIIESKVDLLACDNPWMTQETMLGWQAIIRREAEQKSNRIRAALDARRARGERLGNPANLDPDSARRGRMRGALAMRELAQADYRGLVPMIQDMRVSGMSLRMIAEHLNQEGYLTRTRRLWTGTQVKRVLDRQQK
jgi:hypothetical protein